MNEIMSVVSRKQVLHLASLAKLQLTEDEVGLYQRELTAILDFINQLQAVDVDSLPPTAQVANLGNVTRQDIEQPSIGLRQEDLTTNGLTFIDDQIKIDRVGL